MISDRVLRIVLRSDRFVALGGDLVRVVVAIAVAAGVAMWLLYYAALAELMFSTLHMNDFGKFYYSAQSFLEGQSLYRPSPATAIPVSETETRQFWNMNPPHFHLLVLPLTLLPPLGAILAWATASLIAFVASLGSITRELGLAWTPTRLAWAVVAIVVSSATGTLIVTGQVTFLLLWPVTMAWIAARRGNWSRAAVYLGAGASIKPFLGIFGIYLLVRGRVRAAVSMAAAVAACSALGMLVFGWSAYAEWLRVLSAVDWAWAPMNGSIAGVLARSLGDSPFFTPFIRAPGVITPVSTALGIALVLWILRVLRCDHSPDATDRAFAALLLTALLVSPLGWVYYLWLIVGPGLALWHSSRARPSRLRDGVALGALPGLTCPLVLVGIQGSNPWAAVTIGSIYAWSTACLWASVLLDWTVRNKQQPVVGSPSR